MLIHLQLKELTSIFEEKFKVMTYQERLEAAIKKLKKVYPNATVEQTIDQNGNAIWQTTIPGEKIIESMNVNALEIVVNNLYEAYRVKVGVEK